MMRVDFFMYCVLCMVLVLLLCIGFGVQVQQFWVWLDCDCIDEGGMVMFNIQFDQVGVVFDYVLL